MGTPSFYFTAEASVCCNDWHYRQAGQKDGVLHAEVQGGAVPWRCKGAFPPHLAALQPLPPKEMQAKDVALPVGCATPAPRLLPLPPLPLPPGRAPLLPPC